MAKQKYLLAIDQGTTSSKALVLDLNGTVTAISRNFAVPATYPRADWVQCDPWDILRSVVSAGKNAIRSAGISPEDIAAIGLANQGETIVAFDDENGEPICPAISWQDRRTMPIIDRWRAEGLGDEVHQRTGLRLDPYFSAGKFRWVLDNVPRAKSLLQKGRLRLSTTDGWLLRQLCGPDAFLTDVATASRTMIFNLETCQWDQHLLRSTGIPAWTLPRIVSNCQAVARTKDDIFGRGIAVCGLCVDQQAALFGQRCFHAGQAKATYGTGCFVQVNIGQQSRLRHNGLLTSVAWQIAERRAYVLDGGVYCAGSMLNWLKDCFRLFEDPSEIDELARSVNDSGGVYLIPAFAGIGAPYWLGGAKGAILGLTLGTRPEHLLRGALEAIIFRVKDILDTMRSAGANIELLRVDGGLTRNDLLMQLQADLLGLSLECHSHSQLTALGVGMMAGIGSGMYKDMDDLPQPTDARKVIAPRENQQSCSLRLRYDNWRKACQEVIQWCNSGMIT